MVEENFEFQLLEMLQNERFWQNDTKILKVYCKFSDLLGKTLFSLTIPDFPERVLRSSWDCLWVTMRSMRYGRRGIWVIVCLCVWEFFCDFMCLGVCVHVSLYDMASWCLSLFWVISSGLGWLNRWMSLNVRTTRKKNSFQSRLVAGLGCCPVPPVPAVPTFCSPVGTYVCM